MKLQPSFNSQDDTRACSQQRRIIRRGNVPFLLRLVAAVMAVGAGLPFGSTLLAEAQPATAIAKPASALKSQQADAKASAQAAAKAWAQVPSLLKRIVPPTFPKRDFLVTDFGAVNDGATDCTKAFADAIAACHKAGGGRVVAPAGTFLTGAIHLRSGVNLHLAKGATIKFSTDPQKFLPVVFTRYECTEVMNYSPFIYAFEQENVAVTGEGTLDGQAVAGGWYQRAATNRGDIRQLVEMGNKDVPVAQRVFGEGHGLRPNFVQPFRCKNVLIEGITLTNSPMWVLTPVYCTNVTIRNVTVQTKGPNTDGCDPDSCTDVWIKGCRFSDGDDCIAIKSGRDRDGRRVNIPSENLVIQDCVFQDGHGGVTMGSETAAGIRNVYAENCEFNSTNLNFALRFKTNPARGGVIENVYIRNCKVKTANFGIHMTMRYSSSGASAGESMPVVRNIDIRDSTFASLSKKPVFIQGYSEAGQITDVTIANCTFESVKEPGAVITNAARIHLINNHGGGLE